MPGPLLLEAENFLGSAGQQIETLLRVNNNNCANERFAQKVCEIKAFAAGLQLAVFFFSHSDSRFGVVADRKKLVPQVNFTGLGRPRLVGLKELTRKNHVTGMYPTFGKSAKRKLFLLVWSRAPAGTDVRTNAAFRSGDKIQHDLGRLA